MRSGLDSYQIEIRTKKKEEILDEIQKSPGTYVNSIYDKLHMSKTVVVKYVKELLNEKQIIPLIDSCNPEFEKILKHKSKVQLVYYNQKIEKQNEAQYKVEAKSVFNYLRTLEYKKLSDNLRKSEKELTAMLKELIDEYNKLDETGKKIKAHGLQKMLDIYATVKLEIKKGDHRIKFGEYEKIRISQSINNNDYSIRKVSKLTGYSKGNSKGYSPKYCSKLAKKYPFDRNEPRFPEFRKMLGQCRCCGVWVADAIVDEVEKSKLE